MKNKRSDKNLFSVILIKNHIGAISLFILLCLIPVIISTIIKANFIYNLINILLNLIVVAGLIYYLDLEGQCSFAESIKKGVSKVFSLFSALFAANVIAMGIAFGFLLAAFMVLLLSLTILQIDYTLPNIFTISSILFILTGFFYQIKFAFIPFLVVLEDVDSFEAWDKSSKLVKENKLAGKLLLTGLFLSVAGVLLIMIIFPSNISDYKHYLEVLYKYWGVYYLVYNLFIYKFYKKIK
ncbi:MAG: hypothetical protein MI740_02010 [Halanaerobiales bacterium]|nr:hypothetical protein [Halanaerobiales bacterium]